MRFTGLDADHILTPADCAAIVAHPDGALRVCPPQSRVVVGLTKITSRSDLVAALDIEHALASSTRVDRCVQISTDRLAPS